jgi:hypothetical protein
MKTLLIITYLLYFAIASIAQGSGLSLEGLEAYKLNLERHLDAKIRQAVKPIIDDTLFTLSVNVVMKPTDEINKLINNSLNSNSEIAQEEVQQDFEFVEQKPNEEETLLPLTKLGMWQKKPKTTKTKQLVQNQKTISFVSYHDFVANIEIAFYADKSISPEVNQSIEQVVKNATKSYEPKLAANFFQLSIAKPKIEEKTKPEPSPVPTTEPDKKDNKVEEKKPEENKPTLMGLLIEFKIPLTLILCCLMLLLLGFYIMSKLDDISGRKIDILEKQSQREDAAFKANEIRDFEDHKSGVGKPTIIDEKTFTEQKNQLIEKLNAYLDVHTKPLCNMISKWIKFKNDGYRESLNFLARVIPVDKLNMITELLSDEDRAHWNQVISSGFSAAMEPQAVEFIENQLLMNVLQPQPKLDEQVKDLINELTFTDILKVLQLNPDLGSILITFLNTSQITKIFEVLDNNTVARISRAGMLLTQNSIESKVKELQQTLLRVKGETQRLSPFGEKVQSILKDIQIDKEEHLFKALSMQMEKNNLIEIARSQFPSEIIIELPKDLLKRAFTTLPLISRAEFIISQKPDRQQFLMELVGEGKNREVIEEEFDNIQTDQLRVVSLQRSSEKYWKQYVQIVRSMIQKDESLQTELFPILSKWADKIAEPSGGANGRQAA